LGLHAAPLTRLAPHLEPGAHLVVTLRDGAAVPKLARYLASRGFGASDLTVCEALGGPRERLTSVRADAASEDRFAHPVCAAIDVAGDGAPVGLVPGRRDAIYSTDGQITKAPVRALTLAALAPRRGERLWDIGGGTGSVGIEWLLADPSLQAIAVEPRDDRAARIAENAAAMGVDRLQIVIGAAPDALADQPPPDAIFIGGGLSEALLQYLAETCAAGTRLVANAVTLESEALLTRWREKLGGQLMRIALSHAAPLGAKTGWKASYPIVQWSVTL
ncbi:MAG: precorrin-6Y C5,15-methyltransferase (decarboxylating) subunit CbiT, partial [Alphaproteobacteria bacterium]|nr:precorrin-6Y C5,15-methyltransferase (decarboxylating) subunit CbiT [Alphaproteobacteria bacterium]